ncbi:MAG: DUF4861 family protein [Muribaculaceae bacterium]|nr:DUF4861 family protein [Muribaculaceae bacterium]
MIRNLLYWLLALSALSACSSTEEKVCIKVTAPTDQALDQTVVSIDDDLLLNRFNPYILVRSADGDTVPTQWSDGGTLYLPVTAEAGETVTFEVLRPDDIIEFPHFCVAEIHPEMQDDIAWENDHGGYRLYGPTYHRDGGIVRGYDIWTKSVAHPVLSKRYADHMAGISYHEDHGDGMDVYTVGPTLGAGLNALISPSGDLVMPAGYNEALVMEEGPFRLRMLIKPDSLKVGTDTVFERRLITLDRGSWLNRTDVWYEGLSKPTRIATGIVVHTESPESYRFIPESNAIAYEDLTDSPHNGNGTIYIGIVSPQADTLYFKSFPEPVGTAAGHLIAEATVYPDSVFTYYWGAGWSKGGVINSDQWDSILREVYENSGITPTYTVSTETVKSSSPVAGIFKYIIALGAAVMMPVIFTLLGICIGIPFSRALMSGLKVGVGFIGLSIVTALLTGALGPALEQIVGTYDLNLQVFDMGWPAAASVAYNTAIGAFIIPVCLGINILMLLTKTTRTVNIDLWNYWHYAFIGAVVYFAAGSLLWGFFAAVICYIITLVIADMTARRFQKFYDGVEGISIPQPFCAGFVPFAVIINRLLDRIPGIRRVDIDAEGLKKRFGVLGEPLFLGVLAGIAIGCLTCKSLDEIAGSIPYILGLGIKMGAVMELIPRITGLFIEGLRPISDATRDLVARRFKGAQGLNIGMSPAIVIGHPTTLVVSLLLIPFTLLLAVILPGNQFLPLASLAGMFYIFPLVLPFTRGNVLKTFIVGLIVLVIGLLMVTDMAHAFTLAAHDVYAATGDSAVAIPDGFEGGSLDFASSPLSWLIYKLTAFKSWRIAGAALLVVSTMALVIRNRINIIKNQALMNLKGSDTLQSAE